EAERHEGEGRWFAAAFHRDQALRGRPFDAARLRAALTATARAGRGGRLPLELLAAALRAADPDAWATPDDCRRAVRFHAGRGEWDVAAAWLARLRQPDLAWHAAEAAAAERAGRWAAARFHLDALARATVADAALADRRAEAHARAGHPGPALDAALAALLL